MPKEEGNQPDTIMNYISNRNLASDHNFLFLAMTMVPFISTLTIVSHLELIFHHCTHHLRPIFFEG